MGLGRVKNVTLTYHHGDTFDRIAVIVLDNNDDPVDLTGYAARMQIRSQDNLTLYVELTSGGGGIDINTPTLGRIEFNATPGQMAGDPNPLVPDQYRYNLQVTNGPRVKTYLKGQFWVDEDATF